MAAGVRALIHELAEAGATVATAESLTGGQVAAAVTDVAGASRVYLGGVVAYATEVKRDLLGVPGELLEEHGAVSAACAEEMARGVRREFGATYGVSTTGVAGPDSQEGHPVGTVFVAVAGPDGVQVRELALIGDRARIQAQTVESVIATIRAVLRREEPSVG